MIRRQGTGPLSRGALRAGAAGICALLALGGCDRKGEILIVPEFDETATFDSGWDGWIPAWAAEGAATASVTRQAVGEMGEGAAVRFRLNAPTGRVTAWVERTFEVESDQRYRAEVTLMLGLADDLPPEGWAWVARADSTAPAGGEALSPVALPGGLQGTGEGLAWTPLTLTVEGTSDEDGTLVLALGVRMSAVGAGSVYMDDVRARFFRTF
ncbi:MAG: hypothetical protein ACE5GJ_14165 [Gemmatimonadota bacterium]